MRRKRRDIVGARVGRGESGGDKWWSQLNWRRHLPPPISEVGAVGDMRARRSTETRHRPNRWARASSSVGCGVKWRERGEEERGLAEASRARSVARPTVAAVVVVVYHHHPTIVWTVRSPAAAPTAAQSCPIDREELSLSPRGVKFPRYFKEYETARFSRRVKDFLVVTRGGSIHTHTRSSSA